MRIHYCKYILIFLMTWCLASCGFRLQGPLPLAPPLQKLYLQTNDPYGELTRSLKQMLQVSHVQLSSSATNANTVLNILSENVAQDLLTVSGTQQTRQYRLRMEVNFAIEDNRGRTIVGPETLTENRIITVQADQILGSSNETVLFYQQMRHALAIAIMHRLASPQVTKLVQHTFSEHQQ